MQGATRSYVTTAARMAVQVTLQQICLFLPQDYTATADEAIGVVFDTAKAGLFDEDGKRVH
ncbi:hypothetical protein [uncultured Martelella sp.]|uniref:hypothetical protein n=1 Tax=uncultured Martelella sp. TaxID=392331 RepID=UPI0029C6A51F|nr:hypothetical protein [uncultured Martelella sp.]